MAPPHPLHKYVDGHTQGDNVKVSHDSRSYGPVPYALITGRVWLQVMGQGWAWGGGRIAAALRRSHRTLLLV